MDCHTTSSEDDMSEIEKEIVMNVDRLDDRTEAESNGDEMVLIHSLKFFINLIKEKLELSKRI